MHFWANLTEPIHDAWFHIVFYYRWNPTTYNKFPIDIWENVCNWLDGGKSYILDWIGGNIIKYSNLNHSCPYESQELYLKADNLSINTFIIDQFMPSGRFRIDGSITDGNKSRIFVKGQLFFSVSDHRIEKW